MKYTHNRQTATQDLGITLGDIYYVLFRHKWKIVLCFAAGVLAAAVVFVVDRPLYQSEAKLFIRYVLDSKSLSPDMAESRVKSPDPGGANIINSEIEILTSLDLAQQVVDTIGPEKILAKAGGGKDRNMAAALVREGLIVEVPPKSSVIRIVFQHPDPEVVQPVLSQVVDDYFKKHAEIHQAVGTSDDFLTQETDQLRSQLAQTEQELRKARHKAGVISLDDSKKAYTEQISKIRQEIFNAEAELAERQAALKEIAKLSTPTPETPAVAPEIPAGQIEKYKSLCVRLDLLRKKEQEFLTQFTEQNKLVKEVREQIAAAQVLKQQIEKEHPELARLVLFLLKPAEQRTGPSVDLSTEAARTMALESRIKVLNSQLDQIRSEAGSVDEMEASILELQRKKQLEEANYRYFSVSLEQSRIDEALGAGKISNISRIQAPSPPFRAPLKSSKMMVMLVVGGILCGLAWAFLIEFYLDHSVKRPIEIETKLGLPLFISIPDISSNGHRHLTKATGQEPLRLKAAEATHL